MVIALAAVTAALTFPQGTVVIQKPGPDVAVRVEIARTQEQLSRGLMFRRSLAPRAGMLFVFPYPVRVGFWMKNTLIPLSIAFAGRDGRILRMLDMTPCRSDPCRVYNPSVEYTFALEVNRGAFRRWGVHRGDKIVLRR